MTEKAAKEMSTHYIDTKAKTMIEGIAALDWAGPITSDAEQEVAARSLASLKANAKELKQKKEAITKPLNAALKEVRSQFKPAEDRLASLESLIKTGMLQYHNQQEAAAQAKIDAIARRTGPGRGKLNVATAMSKLAEIEPPKTDMAGAQIKQGPRKLRITDPHALVADMPNLLNAPEIQEAIRKHLTTILDLDGAMPAGVEVYREKLVAGIAG